MFISGNNRTVHDHRLNFVKCKHDIVRQWTNFSLSPLNELLVQGRGGPRYGRKDPRRGDPGYLPRHPRLEGKAPGTLPCVRVQREVKTIGR